MTDFFVVGLAANIDEKNRVIHNPSVRRFKNENDAIQWQTKVDGLRNKGVFPSVFNNNVNYPYISFKESNVFYTINELDQTAERKAIVKSNIDPDLLSILNVS